MGSILGAKPLTCPTRRLHSANNFNIILLCWIVTVNINL